MRSELSRVPLLSVVAVLVMLPCCFALLVVLETRMTWKEETAPGVLGPPMRFL